MPCHLYLKPPDFRQGGARRAIFTNKTIKSIALHGLKLVVWTVGPGASDFIKADRKFLHRVRCGPGA